MVGKLPIWISIGGVMLSFIAGFVNALGFLNAHALTHMTGLVTQLAISTAQNDWVHVFYFGGIVVSFFAGSVISGFIIQQSTLRFGRRYGIAMLLESLLLFISVPLLLRGNEPGYYLAAMASGLQNAMATTFSGAIIRTTHLTGFINDFGVAIGHLLRGDKIDRLRFTLYGAVTSGFFLGAVAGTLLAARIGLTVMLIPASLVGLMGVAYYLYVQHLRRMGRHL